MANIDSKLRNLKTSVERQKNPSGATRLSAYGISQAKRVGRRAYGKAAGLPALGYGVKAAFGIAYSPRLLGRTERLERKVETLERLVKDLERRLKEKDR